MKSRYERAHWGRGGLGGFWGRRYAAVGLAAFLGACAISERAETVYMEQHHVTIALIEAITVAETEDPALADQLYGTETDLDEACAPLREASYRQMSGREMDGALQRAILDSLDGCAAKTREVEGLLWRVDPETATYFFPSQDVASAGTAN